MSVRAAQVQKIAIQLRSKENRDRDKLGATRLPRLTTAPGAPAGRTRFKSEEEKRRLNAIRYAASKKDWQQGLSSKARVPTLQRCAAAARGRVAVLVVASTTQGPASCFNCSRFPCVWVG